MENMFEHTSATTWEFTIQLLEDITNKFSKESLIGSGGYGSVYKGVMDNGEEIAVKKLRYIPGLDGKEFENEFNNLMMAQHQNIVRLIGYCYDLGHQPVLFNGKHIFALVEEKILCFEYLQGGSLDKHISDESCRLDWPTRYKIITGVCDGVNYLHNGSKNPIYHLDLKPANILLDKTMSPKIADFGLSRLFGSNQTCMTNTIIGTRGYMPPEYINRNQITPKFDVFSLGVIIIQIMAGQDGYSKCADMPSQEFIELVHVNWEKRLQKSENTMSSQTTQEVKTCIGIALRCVEADRAKRPTIAEVVDELKKIGASFAPVQTPEELGKLPAFQKVPYTMKSLPKDEVINNSESKQAKWLHENLEEMDRQVKEMIVLVEDDADSFAKKAEMYYRRRPQLITHIESFYRMYRALAERYDYVTGGSSSSQQSQRSSNSSVLESGSESPSSGATD